MLVSTEAVLHIEDTGSGDDKEKLSVSRQLLLHYFKSNLQQLLRLNSNQSKAIHISTVSAPSHMEALNFSGSYFYNEIYIMTMYLKNSLTFWS